MIVALPLEKVPVVPPIEIPYIVKLVWLSSPSTSVSSTKTSCSLSFDLVILDPAVTESVLLTPTGASLIPFTVTVKVPIAISVPSETLYSKESVTVSFKSNASVADAVAA